VGDVQLAVICFGRPMHSLHLRTWFFLGAHAGILLVIVLLA
jgi:hypothetical protein